VSLRNQNELQALTAWGQAGHAVSLTYGMVSLDEDDRPVVGWLCIIGARTIGSVTFGRLGRFPSGYHPDDPIAAVRQALAEANERWPEVLK
jgi:hypothetical protein